MLKNSREEDREASLTDPDNSVDEGQETIKLVARIFKTERWLTELNQTQNDFVS